MDYRNLNAVRTLKLTNTAAKLQTFNPYAAILPKFDSEENNVRHRQSVLPNESAEY